VAGETNPSIEQTAPTGKVASESDSLQQQRDNAVMNAKQFIEVTITALPLKVPLKENPAATTVLVGDNLKMMPRTIAADEALKLVPGVKVDNQADGERVHLSIRGQGILTERGIRGTKIFYDGLPLNDPTGFAPDLFDIDWATVERIEVLRGPAAAFYGSGSSAGILNIISRDGGQRPLNTTASLTAGSSGFTKGLAELNGTAGGVQYRVSQSLTRGDGYRDHTAFNADNLYGKFKWNRPSRLKLSAIISLTNFYNQNAEGLNLTWLAQDRRMANPDAITYNEYQRTHRLGGGLTGKLNLSEKQDVSFGAFLRDTRYRESVPSSIQYRQIRTPGVFGRYDRQVQTGAVTHHLSVGADYGSQSIEEHRRANLGKGVAGSEILSRQDISQSSTGVYLLERLDWGRTWGMVISLRHDRIDNELTDHLQAGGIDLSGQAWFQRNSARVGLVWNPKPNMGWYANWGTGFLPPATEELANNPEHLGGFNRNLTSATSSGEEIGWRGLMGRCLVYDLALFHLSTADDFGRYRIASRPLETFYRNTGSSERYGLEALISWRPIKLVDLKAAYTYSHFTYSSVQNLESDEALSGTFLPNLPGHQFYLDLQSRLHRHWLLGLSMEMQSRAYIDATNATWIDGFTLLHLRLSHQRQIGGVPVEFSMAGRNILGQEYIAFTEPDPDGNSYQPAPTAEWFFALRVSL